ncbi:MAG: D-cysteine desulfhydrase family protein [Christensenellaceae bacterium]|jgi:D-cysteine desulfhydrase family pyridoxal phosphate-dependent enzyme|nr:D-cysteine desulfhydrase family protein [Christensenellaceae bacterium]
MDVFSNIPRISLALLPTPLYRLPNVSEALAQEVYIKRDDMTGVALGGNKVRKLEFLLADALNKGCDTILTTGGAQSNHAMLTAACCNRLGLNCILVLKKRGVYQKLGNQLLNDLLGAEVRFVDTDTYKDVYAEMDRICDDLRAKGHKPYSVPVGGSVPLGSLGYALAVQEAVEQAARQGIAFSDIICTAGSGGTLAGVVLGARLFAPSTRVTGIVIDPDDYRGIVTRLVNEAAALLGSEVRIAREDVLLHDCYGAGYAIPSTPGVNAMRFMAQKEGVILDPVYTGKTFAGLMELCEQGYFAGRGKVLFIHSGGAGGLFAIDIDHPKD